MKTPVGVRLLSNDRREEQLCTLVGQGSEAKAAFSLDSVWAERLSGGAID